MFLHKRQFSFCPFHRLTPILKGIPQAWCTFFQDIANVISMLKEQLCTANSLIQFQSLGKIEITDTR